MNATLHNFITEEKRPKKVTSNTVGKRFPRGDGVDERSRHYKYVKWDKKRPQSRTLHKSHQYASRRTEYVRQQNIPAFCVLCPKQGYMYSRKRCIQHYGAVHIPTGVTIGKIFVLRCRCSDVRSRGSDGRARNAHYRCTVCWKPCDQRSQLGIHLLTRHHVNDEDVKDLLLKKAKK